MTFNTLYFLFAFFPISVLLYFVTPQRFRNLTLLVISVVFYAWGRPEYLVLLLFSVVFNYCTALEIDTYRKQERPDRAKLVMVIAVVLNLLMLGFFKYYGFLVENINALLHINLHYTQLPAPVGLSFYTFTVLSYIFDIYREKAKPQPSLLKFALYVTMFPKLISGPIVEYHSIEEQLNDREVDLAQITDGVNLFLVGLMKKVLLADNLGTTFSSIQSMDKMSIVTAWLGMIFYSLQLYFDFSGYSDMAIGLAKIFGFDIAKNFDHPYLSKNIAEFWRRWHISLGGWFRDYVYIPLGGNRCGKKRQLINLAVVWLLTGIWHGAAWNFVFWGIWHGFFVCLERFVIKDKMDRLPDPVRIAITDLLVFIGWVFFFSPSLGSAFGWLGQMIGIGGCGFFDSTARYLLTGNALLLVISILCCGTLVRKLHEKLVYRSKFPFAIYISTVLYLVLLIACVAFMVSSTYSSFLYVQF